MLFVTGSFRVGGAELQLAKLLEGLAPHIPDRRVAFLQTGPLYAGYVSTGAELIELSRGTGTFASKLNRVRRRLRHIAAESGPDLVHTQLPQTNILTCLALWDLDVPLLVSERGMGRSRPLWEKMLRPIAYRRADFVVTNSQATRDRVLSRERVRPERVCCIPNIVDCETAPPGEDGNLPIQGIPLPDGTRVIVSVGGLRPVKGYEDLLEAFHGIAVHREDVRLLIVGEGPERNRLEDRIRALGIGNRVFLTGYRSDVPKVLRASNCFVSSSHSEGQSNAILEAMAHGLPVVATAVGGTPDLIHDGTNGILVPPGSPGDIRNALEYLLDNPEKASALGTRARASVDRKHSMKAVVGSYLRLYSEVAGVRGRNLG